ncbi:MAG TPA: hypothetical protein VFE21_06845 [Rubrobacteraceae bacterium]|nr:hypothetical protein [Rubrobacteraceae bacterium]
MLWVVDVGTNDTTAVFTFDQPVSATCCAGYELIPTDLVDAFRTLAGQDTTELVVAVEGQLTAAETVRGTNETRSPTAISKKTL